MKTSTAIHPSAILNEPFRRFQGGKPPTDIEYREGSIASGVSIGAGAVIGLGAILRDGVVIDYQCIVEPNVSIGNNTLLTYRAIIGNESVIGDNCVIGGIVAERTIIDDNCRVFGKLVHKQIDTTQPWDEHAVPEPSAHICANSFVGFGAVVVGGISVGPRSYICSGAIVTRDVPPNYVASGVNILTPASKWPGALSNNPAFERD